MKLFKTDNIDLAAYLKLCGHEITAIEPKEGKPYVAVFYFIENSELLENEAVFIRRGTQVEPRGYIALRRDLRDAAIGVTKGGDNDE